MNSTWTSRMMSVAECLRMRHLPGAVFGLFILAIAVWAVPRRIDRVISSDGAKVWDSPKAPPQLLP